MARSCASASSCSSSSYELLERDPLYDEELVVLPSDTLSETNDTDEQHASGNEGRAGGLQDSHLAAASAEEDYAADWILGSSSYYFASTPAPMQPPPAPSALQPFPPEVGPVALSGPASPRHSLTQGGAACSHGERMVLIHLASSDSGGNTGQDSGSAWSKEDDEDMRAEEQVADSPTGSQQQQQQQRPQVPAIRVVGGSVGTTNPQVH
mmetsp:Transcript_28380/g.73040  ORF Transcript_28380/g.73040 Transcript_28380/m.73040 type:complete len:209 (+) Transcript_28380:126-752(+)